MTFLDTPGHSIFSKMRARGADVTDIVVIIIAADDGIMPQTEEAIKHAKAAGKTIIVAINKVDLPAADPMRTMTQLMEHELVPVDMGGEIECVKVSANTGEGVDQLLELMACERLETPFFISNTCPMDGIHQQSRNITMTRQD